MAEHPALRTAAAHGLPGERSRVVIAPPEAGSVLAVARVDRLGGFLARSVQAGVVDADDATVDAIESLWHDELASSVAVEAHVLRLASALEGSGVDWRITKGPAVAHLDYDDRSLRSFGDVDVLVHPESWRAALRVLTGAGWHREAPELAPGFDERFGKGATLTAGGSLEADLHLRFAIGRFGVLSRPAELFTPADPLLLGGRTVPALAAEGRLLHACYHATLGGFRHLRASRDVAQLALAHGDTWQRATERAQHWGGACVVAAAVRQAWGVFDLDPDHALARWAAGVHPTRAEASALRMFVEERSFRRQALTAVPVLPVRQRARYLWGLTSSRRHGR